MKLYCKFCNNEVEVEVDEEAEKIEAWCHGKNGNRHAKNEMIELDS